LFSETLLSQLSSSKNRKILNNGQKPRYSDIMDRLPHEILENNVNGLEVRICGTSNDESSFQKHAEFYDELISDSACVVLQYSPDKSDFARDIPLLGETQMWKFTSNIRDLCEKHKKKIFNIDPLNVTGLAIDSFVALGSWGGAFYISISDGIRKKLSRREFLGIWGALVYLGLGTHGFTGPFTLLENPTGKFLRVPTYGYKDFRNVKIAEGLELIPEMLENNEGSYILALHSWGHTKAIDYYLTHRTVRQAKEFLYSVTYNLVNDSLVKEYDMKDGLWTEISRRPY